MKPSFSVRKQVVLTLLILIGCLSTTRTFGLGQKTIISIEKSQYGMLFTNIQVNGKNVKAIIDFGDPNRFQLSETLVKKLKIPLVKTNKAAIGVNGQYQVYDGVMETVKVGDMVLKDETFSSSPGDMELISSQISTDFQAVVGWGFFSDYYLTMNYSKNEILLSDTRETQVNVCFSANLDSQFSHLVMQSKINGINANLIIDTGAPLSLLDSTFFLMNNIPSSDTVVKHLSDIIPLKTVSTTFISSTVSISYLIYDLTLTRSMAVGIIGGDIFDKYKVYIEPKEKLIYFIKEQPAIKEKNK